MAHMAIAAAAKSTAAPIPVKASGSHFYKYSKFSGERRGWLKEIILEHRLYVPNLSQLEDPADGRPKLARKSEDELYSFFYNGPQGVLGRNPRMTVEDQIREGVILDVNLRLHGKEVVTREIAKSFNRELEDWRIYSLSKRYNNLSMWEKYGGNYSGYCLEFANDGPFFSCANEVSYADSLEFDITNPEHRNGYWFFCKKQEYSNEEEVRVLVPRKSDDKVQIDPSCLTRVILGWKMSDTNQAQIRKWAKQRSPELKVVRASYDELDQVLRITD